MNKSEFIERVGGYDVYSEVSSEYEPSASTSNNSLDSEDFNFSDYCGSDDDCGDRPESVINGGYDKYTIHEDDLLDGELLDDSIFDRCSSDDCDMHASQSKDNDGVVGKHTAGGTNESKKQPEIFSIFESDVERGDDKENYESGGIFESDDENVSESTSDSIFESDSEGEKSNSRSYMNGGSDMIAHTLNEFLDTAEKYL